MFHATPHYSTWCFDCIHMHGYLHFVGGLAISYLKDIKVLNKGDVASTSKPGKVITLYYNSWAINYACLCINSSSARTVLVLALYLSIHCLHCSLDNNYNDCNMLTHTNCTIPCNFRPWPCIWMYNYAKYYVGSTYYSLTLT